ncbi:MAG: arginine repressor [Bacteroidales bacterium]|nr:arginine repressor [Lachnoclostridium sp.]MCM1385641.1 arginine repressor [Lachnoclostridium sp.]MCM1465955.1 arginine repressor [Bacteroidales bacterium]
MKKSRQQKIIEIIENCQVETQEALVEHLKREGFEVTQATVSRDIRELKLSKVPVGEDRQKYVVLKQEDRFLEDKYSRVLRDGFSSMDMAQNILVIKTVSGMAMAVAAAVDALKFPEVVGCIAGDDTIMVAVRTVEETKKLMNKIHAMIEK